jgi:hypothetical protein
MIYHWEANIYIKLQEIGYIHQLHAPQGSDIDVMTQHLPRVEIRLGQGRSDQSSGLVSENHTDGSDILQAWKKEIGEQNIFSWGDGRQFDVHVNLCKVSCIRGKAGGWVELFFNSGSPFTAGELKEDDFDEMLKKWMAVRRVY